MEVLSKSSKLFTSFFFGKFVLTVRTKMLGLSKVMFSFLP